MGRCEAEELFDPIHNLIKKLSDGVALSKNEQMRLIKLLENYWSIECPKDNPCNAVSCFYAKPIDWVVYHGYTCLADLLGDFECEEDALPILKDKGYIDVFTIKRRRSGHYNP